MEGLSPFEQAVLDKLLAGDHPVLRTLRAQAESARLKSRENTGAGFYCYFEVSPALPRIDDASFDFGDVNAELPELTHGAGFVLFVRGGKLDCLEGYSYDEPWPAAVHEFRLNYQADPRDVDLPKALGG